MTTDPTMIIGFAAVAVKTSASLRKLEQEMVPEGLGACDHEQGCQEGQLGGWGGGLNQFMSVVMLMALIG